MKPLISCLIGLVILGCADKDADEARGQYIQTDKTLPSHLTLKLTIFDAYGNVVQDIEFFKGEKNIVIS